VFADHERDILHDIIRQRYQFAPYIYSMARRTYDDALPLCRPMYYDYPEEDLYQFYVYHNHKHGFFYLKFALHDHVKRNHGYAESLALY
jgi:tRNA(Ile)-lysidine synthase TilS/MesJ